jgi:ADP-ribose pyrophosphatase YjhB (NUDIX family)
MNLFIKLLYQASKFILILLKPLTNGVRLLLVREDQILLVKHMYEDKWYLPGGLVERGETLDEAVRREAMEEVGASLNDLQLFGAYSNFREHRNDHVIVFISHDFSLNGISDHEIEKTAFFSFDSLPENVSEGSSNRIKEYVSNERIRFGNW